MTLRVLVIALACAAALPAAAQLRSPARSGGRPPSATASPRSADYIVAVVNSEPITNNEVRTRLVRFEQQLAQSGAPVPGRAELTRQVVERLISEKAQMQLAREINLRIDDAQVDG